MELKVSNDSLEDKMRISKMYLSAASSRCRNLIDAARPDRLNQKGIGVRVY